MTSALRKRLPDARRNRALSKREKRIIALLGLPTFGLALTVTVVVTYVPLVAKQFTSSNAIVGLIIASEGVVAFFLPAVAGGLSDQLRTRVGGRLPFMIAGLPFATAALVLIGFVHTVTLLIVCIIIFFIAYYLMYEPYRALYPDLMADDASGRAQSIQGLWRGAGTGLALAGGGFLFAGTKWLPFAVSAALFAAATLFFLWRLLSTWGVPQQRHREFAPVRSIYPEVLASLRKQRPLRNFIIANTLWELSLAAMKTFMFLWLTAGLGNRTSKAAFFVSLGALVILIAAPIGGKLADTYGKVKIMRLAIPAFGIAMLFPALTTHPWAILLIMPFGALGGAIVLTLPYALLMPMMPAREHGKLTGLYSTSRGLGIMLGPLLGGGAISVGKRLFPAHGYGAMWLVSAIAMLASLPFLYRLPADEA